MCITIQNNRFNLLGIKEKKEKEKALKKKNAYIILCYFQFYFVHLLMQTQFSVFFLNFWTALFQINREKKKKDS